MYVRIYIYTHISVSNDNEILGSVNDGNLTLSSVGAAQESWPSFLEWRGTEEIPGFSYWGFRESPRFPLRGSFKGGCRVILSHIRALVSHICELFWALEFFLVGSCCGPLRFWWCLFYGPRFCVCYINGMYWGPN